MDESRGGSRIVYPKVMATLTEAESLWYPNTRTCSTCRSTWSRDALCSGETADGLHLITRRHGLHAPRDL